MSTTGIRHRTQEPATRVEAPPAGVRHRTTGVTAMVVAAVIALLAAGLGAVVWLAGIGTGQGSSPTNASTPDELVAQDFLSAFTTFDAERVALSLADDASMPEEWWRDLQRYEAWGTYFIVQPCEQMSTSAAGTNIGCAFDFHALGTDQLDRAPFGRNAFTLRVDDGKVESFQATDNPASNGFDQYYDAVGSWVRANHPGDWEFMDSYEDLSDADFPRWLRLWDERLAQYENRVATYLEATAGG